MKKKIIIAGTVLTLTFSGLSYVGTANVEANISEKKENVSQKLNKVETDILNSTKKVNEINLDIDSLESALVANEQEVERMTKEADKYETEINALKKEIIVLEEEIKERNEILKERLSSYQNSGGDLGFMEVIFGSTGFEEFISRFTAVTTITKADNKLVEEQKNAINKVEEKEVQVKEKLTETEKTKKELTDVNKKQKAQKKELNKSKKSVESNVTELEDKKSAYIAEGNDLEALEQQIEEEIRATEVGLSENTETHTNTSANEDEATETEETSEATNSTESAEQVSREQVDETPSSNTENNTRNNQTTRSQPTPSQNSTQASTGSTTNRQPAAQTPAPTKKPSKPKKESAPAKPSGGNGIIADAHALTGTKYQLGGTTPSAFDCSGYTSFVYKQNGINLPRTASAQYAAYPKVSKGQLRAGDLVFFSSSPGSGGITHVGISLGGSQYIGSQTSTGVAVASINDPYYWGPRFVGGARPN